VTDYLSRLLTTAEGLAVACLGVAAFVAFARRNRGNRFLFWGWLGIAFVFSVFYIGLLAIMRQANTR